MFHLQKCDIAGTACRAYYRMKVTHGNKLNQVPALTFSWNNSIGGITGGGLVPHKITGIACFVYRRPIGTI